MPGPGESASGGSRQELPPTADLHTKTTAPARERSTVPKQIGHYHVKDVIGGGGMGTVYEALQEHPRRIVALKVMKAGVSSRSALRRFEYESQILARLRHPNIAQVYEAGTHDGGEGSVPFFALEYIPNARSITEFARDKQLRTRERLELFGKVCDAINHGHQKGIIHRDLKPGNILVDASGEPKIIDFGVARATDSDLALTTLQTDVGQLIGTLQYMSPEQVQADPHAIDARSDIYSLGVVLYELLCDRLPYNVSGNPVLEAARIIQQEPPTRLSTVDTKLRGDLETIVLTALEKERERRYQTADDLRQDITRYLRDQPIVAHRPSVAYVLGRRLRATITHHPVGTLALVAVLAALSAMLVGNSLVLGWPPARELWKQFVAITPWPSFGHDTLDKVRVIRITDETMTRGEQLAASYGFVDVRADSLRSFRRLHGPLMERLASAGVRSVTWDLTFKGEQPYDEGFVTGVKALRREKIGVVITVTDWPLGDREQPHISGNIAREVRWGGSTVNFLSAAEWNLHLYLRRGTRDVQPSLTLQSVAANLQPTAEPVFTPDAQREVVVVIYFRWKDPQQRREKLWLSETDEIVLSAIEPYDGVPGMNGRQVGDEVGVYIIEVPDDRALEDASVDYHWVLEADPADVRSKLEGMAVVIGNFRSNSKDRFDHPDGRTLPGAYGHAAGLDMLLSEDVIRVERTWFAWVLSFLAAAIGVLFGVAATSRPARHAALLTAALLLVIFSGIFAYHVLGWFVYPFVPLLAVIVACELAVGVNRACRARLQ